MSRPVQLPLPVKPRTEGNLDEVGAVLCAIVRLASGNGDLPEEDCRAVYALACIGLTEWRMLDAAQDMPKVKP